MTEDVQINISGTIDGSALAQLRKQLNDARNELNAVARETEKTDARYKQLKATTAELNRLIKSSDADLRKYAQSMIQTETAVTKVNTAKTKLVTNTDKLGRSFTSLKTNVAGYSSTLVNMTTNIVKGNTSMLEAVGTLGLYAGGWGAVAYAIYEVTKQIIDNEQAITNWRLNFQNRTYEEEQALLPPELRQPKKPDGTVKFMTPEELDALGLTPNIPPKDVKDIIVSAPKTTSSNSQKVAKEIVKVVYDDLTTQMTNLFGGSDQSAKEMFRRMQTVSGMLPAGAETEVPAGLAEFFKGSIPEMKEDTRNLLDNTQQVYSGISSIIGVLNVGTETFVSKLIGGFGTVLTIMEAIKTFNSILSIIPGFASGGIATGLFMAGEKGAELVHVGDNQARVYNHNETMRMLNSQSTNPNVNVYLSANISEKFITAKIEQYTNQKRFKRV